MIEVGQVRIWTIGNGSVFTILKINYGSTADWKHYHNGTIWEDRVSYILNNSIKLSPVLKEIYES
jgi:hypothetical protein